MSRSDAFSTACWSKIMVGIPRRPYLLSIALYVGLLVLELREIDHKSRLQGITNAF